jgi:hypothetical protein
MLELESQLEPFTKKPFFCQHSANRPNRDEGDTNWLIRETASLLTRVREGIDSFTVGHLLNLIHYTESLSSTLKESWKQSVVKVKSSAISELHLQHCLSLCPL